VNNSVILNTVVSLEVKQSKITSRRDLQIAGPAAYHLAIGVVYLFVSIFSTRLTT